MQLVRLFHSTNVDSPSARYTFDNNLPAFEELWVNLIFIMLICCKLFRTNKDTLSFQRSLKSFRFRTLEVSGFFSVFDRLDFSRIKHDRHLEFQTDR